MDEPWQERSKINVFKTIASYLDFEIKCKRHTLLEDMYSGMKHGIIYKNKVKPDNEIRIGFKFYENLTKIGFLGNNQQSKEILIDSFLHHSLIKQ